MDSFSQNKAGETTRGSFDFQAQHDPSEPRRPSSGASLTQSRSQQPPVPRFSIQTSADSLSSGFKYDTRLRQLGVSNEEWRQFTNEIVNEAKLSLEDDKVAWGAGIATGTAGSALLLLLGPVAGYYTGKAVHKRTVVEKVKERMLDNGPMNKVLKKWNEGTWAKKGFHTWIELPDEPCSIRGTSDTKRFRIVITPGNFRPPQPSMSPPPTAHASVPPPPLGSFQQTSVPQTRPVPPPPIQRISVTQVPPIVAPAQQVPPQPLPNPNEGKYDYPPPPPLSTAPSFHQPPPIIPIENKYDYPPPPPSSTPSFHQPPAVPHRNSVVQPPSFQQSSVPHTHPMAEPPAFNQPSVAQVIPEPIHYQAYHPPVERYDHAPPPVPAKPPTQYNSPNNQIYEMPNNQGPNVFELPGNQGSIAELPSESRVHYYEMDGGGLPPTRR